MTVKELEELLIEHKKVISEYLIRNLSVYHWYQIKGVDKEKAREELKEEVFNSRFPNDFVVLKKYSR